MRAIHNLEDLKLRRKNLRNNSTPQEIVLWSRLKSSQLGYKFRRQHSVGQYIVDFCCPERRLIIEIDGSQHGEEGAERYNQKRTNYLQSLGFRVLRFWNNEINVNLDSVLGTILEEVHHTTPDPSSSEEGKKREI